jgi:hypothetical protein
MIEGRIYREGAGGGGSPHLVREVQHHRQKYLLDHTFSDFRIEIAELLLLARVDFLKRFN